MSSITIIGNVFVITAFIIDTNLRKYSNYFILNQSVADLLIGVLIPPYAPFLLYKRNWRLGPFACTVWLVLDYVVGSASVLCIVVISLDRYLLVSRGLNYVAGQKVYKAIMASNELPAETRRLIRDLRQLRNQVAHAKVVPTPDSAQAYLVAVERVIELVRNYRKNLPGYTPDVR
jgi:hypothetical protein